MTPLISDITQRRLLNPSPTPYFESITPTIHIGYRKGMTGARWVLRRRIEGRYVTRTFKEFVPDDHLPADGKKVLSYEQMLMRILNMSLETTQIVHKRLCSFCKKTQQQVEILIAGPDCYICDACIDICQSIILEHRKASND